MSVAVVIPLVEKSRAEENSWWPPASKPSKMAVFRKILNTAKNKMKTPNIQFEGEKDGNPRVVLQEDNEMFERRKQEWQDELDTMSEFLLLKSTEEQKEEGAQQIVDTCFVDDREGMPVLKAVFDIHHFTPDDVNLSIEDNQLVLDARCLDDRDDRVYRKTMLRRIDLPKYVDHKMMHCELSEAGILTIEMPFHLPPQRKPQGPNVFPIVEDKDGKKKIRLGFMVGSEFSTDDVKIESNGRRLLIRASYNEEIGKYGYQTNARELKREYLLPDTIEVDGVYHKLAPDGKLYIEITLKDEKPFECEVTAEEV